MVPLARRNGGPCHVRNRIALCRGLCRLAARPRGLVGARGRGHHLGPRSVAHLRPRPGIPWGISWGSDGAPYGRWFPDAALNTSVNCLDRHVAAGRGGQAALIWDSAMTGRIETFTYAALLDRVAKTAGALAALGVGEWRPGGDLHADGAGGGDRDARLRSAGRGPFGGVRRLRGGRTGHAHRRCATQGHRLGLLRLGAGAGGDVQAAAGRRDRAVAAQAAMPA